MLSFKANNHFPSLYFIGKAHLLVFALATITHTYTHVIAASLKQFRVQKQSSEDHSQWTARTITIDPAHCYVVYVSKKEHGEEPFHHHVEVEKVVDVATADRGRQ